MMDQIIIYNGIFDFLIPDFSWIELIVASFLLLFFGFLLITFAGPLFKIFGFGMLIFGIYLIYVVVT